MELIPEYHIYNIPGIPEFHGIDRREGEKDSGAGGRKEK